MMREKTAAERQMEALLKLKKQSGKAKPVPAPQAPPAAGEAARAPKLVLAKPPARRKAGRALKRSLPLSGKAWEALVARFGQEGRLRPSQALGDWAALLASRLPEDLKALSESEWAELIVRIENWCDTRHKKP